MPPPQPAPIPAGALPSGADELDAAIARIDRDLAAGHPPARLTVLKGLLHHKRGRTIEAIETLRRAVDLAPDDAMSVHGLGVVLQDAGQFAAAVPVFQEAIRLDPGATDSLVQLAETLRRLGRHAAAIPLLDRARALAPARLDIQWMECWARMHACDWQDEAARKARFLAAAIEAGYPVSPFLVLMLDRPPHETLLWTRAWAERNVPPSPAPLTRYALPPDAARPPRIRVGYLSADFAAHATAHLVTELFLLHDRARFETVGYRIGRDDGSAAGRAMAQALDRIVDLAALDDRGAAARIAADDVEILVDLNGYTAGSRPGILAHRPAPIQVGFLGYPGGTGTPSLDYLIADAVVAPCEHAAHYDEALVHLPGSYQPNDRRRPSSDPFARRTDHGLPGSGFVFCCFNNPYKLTPTVFAAWMRILNGTPSSVLWLLEDNDVAVPLRAAAAAQGVSPERLVFAPRTGYEAHLARLGLGDLFLDTLPCNAHTTASEALWCGLPVLTCLGDQFVGRVAASLLRAAGLPELIAPNLAAYEAAALALAADPHRLGALRARLVSGRLTCELFDTPRYAANYEAALTHMVRLRKAGRPPEPFTVEGRGERPT